jgi:hypothetical protein
MIHVRTTTLVSCASCVVLFALLLVSALAFAAPVRVRVRGSAKLTAHAARGQVANGGNELVLSGSLADDAGQPMSLQTVTIRVEREADAHDVRVLEAMRTARGCEPAGERRAGAAWSVRPSAANDRAREQARRPPTETTSHIRARRCPNTSLGGGIIVRLSFDCAQACTHRPRRTDRKLATRNGRRASGPFGGFGC